MNISRFRKIIEYSDSNKDDIESKVRKFYSLVGMSSDKEVLNILQIVRTFFLRRGYLVLEIPFADEEIGALCYKGDALGYIVLNTSLPKVNVNFAICHEIYHVYFQKGEFKPRVEFANDHYYEYEDEFAANLFAGMILMPETSFRLMYHKFKTDSKGNELDTMVRLMNYYEVPYMSVLIRCNELGLTESNSISEEFFNMDCETIREKFVELWLDYSILEATKKDDYAHLESIVNQFGREYIKDSYLNERTLKKVIRNMRILYSEIKGE
ncbi:ImmA/IrrE family metallo-endopeptidase [Bariatricus sp. SGI.154]|uniref:ImmA/IrrE family metallo-endopeptidase n=1 Tax=Bariatricus sp. SGI.154 TaxID=3420549 RepID=UPI003D073E46